MKNFKTIQILIVIVAFALFFFGAEKSQAQNSSAYNYYSLNKNQFRPSSSPSSTALWSNQSKKGKALFKAKKAMSVWERSWGMLSEPGVDAKKAWTQMKNVSQSTKLKCKNSGVVVAVIDTGVDFNHSSLRESKWVNKAELFGKPGVDDDYNGFVDDLHGWDFSTNKAIQGDSHGHGTHIAGIIAGGSSSPESNQSFYGVCPGVQIMAVKYFNPNATGSQNLTNTIKAFNYAVKNGATIINYSGGGSEFSKAEYEAVKLAAQKGILVVAAAGNERSSADLKPYYPAAYALKNVISVAAVDQSGQLLSASNWGIKNVDIAAPGNAILSTQRNNTYSYMQGTSQATAFVSGIAALLLTENPKLKFGDLRKIIEDSGVVSSALSGKTATSKRASASMAISLAQGYYSTPNLTVPTRRMKKELNKPYSKRKVSSKKTQRKRKSLFR